VRTGGILTSGCRLQNREEDGEKGGEGKVGRGQGEGSKVRKRTERCWGTGTVVEDMVTIMRTGTVFSKEAA
jgi:hypothetical protein